MRCVRLYLFLGRAIDRRYMYVYVYLLDLVVERHLGVARDEAGADLWVGGWVGSVCGESYVGSNKGSGNLNRR